MEDVVQAQIITGRPKAELMADLEAALERVRILLQSHAGDIEILSVTELGEVTLEFQGTCVSCPAQAMTVGATILPVVEKVEGVRKVNLKSMTVSPAAVKRIREMFKDYV